MAYPQLETLLLRIRDGEASASELEQARSLLRTDPRVPDELRDALDDEPEIAAGALLPLFGIDDGLLAGLADAVIAEAGALHLADTRERADDADGAEDFDPAELEAPLPWPVRDAVVAAAGRIDVSAAVLADIGARMPVAEVVRSELVAQVGDAVRTIAGDVDVADAVMARLGLSVPAIPVREAIAAEAGRIDVTDAVVPERRLPIADAVRAEAGRADVVARVGARLAWPASPPVAAAVRAEAGRVELAEIVLARLSLAETRVPVADAVRAEAGSVDVAGTIADLVAPWWVSALLDRSLSEPAHRLAARRLMTDPAAGREMTAYAELGRNLRASVLEEAGEIGSVWPAVASAIGIAEPDEVPGYDGAAVAAAVRAEAGTIDVTADVMRLIRRRSLAPVEEIEAAPANRGFTWGAIAVAAVAILTLLVGRNFTATPVPVEEPIEFASAAEITVDDLSYGEDTLVQVIQEEGDDAALIIWVDEGANL